MEVTHTKIAVRAILPVLLSGGLLLSACMSAPEPGPSKEEIWKQIYSSRLENLRALDRAFNELGQEYFKLEIEYKNAGRDDLASISRERAKAFHEQHLQFQQRIAELETIDGRLRRGERALDIQAGRAEAARAPRQSAPGVTAPARIPSSESTSSTPYRPPSTAGYAAPTRTPTPTRQGLELQRPRFSEPIIITDPKLNNP